MIALLASLALGSCTVDDVACWRAATLTQSERADRAEQRAVLEKSARDIVQAMLDDESTRAARWRKIALDVAPKDPMFFERPTFWLAVGFVAGGALVIGTAYAIKPALFKQAFSP